MYGMSYRNVGLGIVGGYVWTMEANTTRLADMTVKVVSGTRASNIPVENAPNVPMFDWRQLQRWGVPEDRLPEDSVIRFRELSLWQQFKWRILTAIAIFALQGLLIFALLLARRRARRTRLELEKYKESLERLVGERTAELLEARDQALASNRSKSAFLANVSHELRTPLNAILGFSNLLRQHGATEEQRRDLDIINRSGEHLLGLINEVLDLAKIEAGRAAIAIEPCDLRALLREVTDMIRPRAEEKLLVLRLVQTPEVPRFIRTDASRLRQVLINLLGNAVKHTDQGSVTLRSTSRPTEDRNHPRLIFEVEDTGIGIAAEDQGRVFEPFVQLAEAGMEKGTGLGLAITRQFIELMGGTIQIQSSLGKGSCFRVEIPVERTKESEDKVPGPEPEQVAGIAAGLPECRVLVVEDDQENQKLMKYLLQRAGFQVRIAQDGAEGVECFREWQPHFIWMDLRMPVMNGFDTTRRIRTLEGGREVKIAAVTASGFAEERNEALAAGMDDYIRKPYRPSEILECMARQLGDRYQRKAIAVAGEPAAELRPEDLAALPQELRAGLREALLALDVERISAAIGRVSQENAPLGSVLARCASRYAYTAMLDATTLDLRGPE
jgi:signal transduction histidine kinase/DNA-binding response OmpR family regulator